MKVWIVNPFDNLSAEGYRPQRYEMLACALVKRGHSVRYWTSDFSHANKSPRRLQNDLFSLDYDLTTIPTRPYQSNVSLERIRSHREFATSFLKLAEKEIATHKAPQLIVVSLPPLSLAPAAFALREKYGIRVVVDVQDLWPHNFSRLLPRGFRWLGRYVFARQYALFRKVMSGADLVTGVADAYGPVARAAGARAYARCYLGFPMGTSGGDDFPGRSSRRLAYVGGLGRTYDLDTVIRALASLEGWTLDVFGTGGRESELRRLAQDCGVGDRVSWRGYLGRDALRAELCRCTAGIVPMSPDSRVAIPNKIGDYVDACLPVVSSLPGESATLLSRHDAISIYEPGNVHSFVRAVSRLDSLSPDFAALRHLLSADDIYRVFAELLDRKLDR